MVKEELKLLQPQIYQILENSFKNHHVVHSYLINGFNPKLKLDTAFFIAQSIIEGKLADETCPTCQRIKNLNYMDLIYIDGSVDTIKKETIEDLQKHFSLKASEEANKKIYIINVIENTSSASLNSLLKFLEEPSGEIYAILISNDVNKVLDTIISRCVNLNFNYQDPKIIIDTYINNGYSLKDAFNLAYIINYFDSEIEENECFTSANYFYDLFIKDYENNLDHFLYQLETELMVYKDKDHEINCLKWLIDLLIVLFTRINYDLDDQDYCKFIKIIADQNVSSIAKELMEIKGLLNKTFDYRLLMERLIYHIKGERDGRNI